MSANKRKIGLYTFEFIDKKTNDKLNGDNLNKYVNDLLKNIMDAEFEDKKITIETSNKFYYLVEFTNGEMINILFESAKVGHRPKLVDEETGVKRDNPKTLHEGEAEMTHLSIKYDADMLILALEERKVGLTIGQIATYFNNFINKCPPKKQYHVEYAIIPYKGFIEHIDDFSRITVGHVIIDKHKIGTEYLNQAEFGRTVRNPVELIFKANNRGSMAKELIIDWWNKLTGTGQEITRIRIEGESHEGAKIKLDTDSLKMIRHVDVNVLQDTGIVDSKDIFEKLNTILQDDIFEQVNTIQEDV